MTRSMDSTAVIEQYEGKIDREPRMHMMADRSNESSIDILASVVLSCKAFLVFQP